MLTSGLVRYVAVAAVAVSLPAIASAQAWAPCGGNSDKLWAWGWAGSNGEHVSIEHDNFGPRIVRMTDLSGNGNDFIADSDARPGYQSSFSRGGYSTSLPIVAVDTFADGNQIFRQYLNQNATMSTGQFYLAFAGYESRPAGHRWLWGSSGSNRVRLNQEKNRVDVTIGGGEHQLSVDGAWSDGPVLIEVWRDASNRLTVVVNGSDRTDGNVTNSATFNLSGIGGGAASGGSAWDDYAFEYIACDGLPTSTQRDEAREYLRDKWDLFGQVSPPPPPPPPTPTPNPPTDLVVE